MTAHVRNDIKKKIILIICQVLNTAQVKSLDIALAITGKDKLKS